MTQAIGRVFRSKVVGFVAIAALAFGLVSLGRIWWEAWPWFGPTLTAVPHPKIDELERIIREQIIAVRKESEAILADRRSTQRQRGLAYGQLGKVYLADNFTPAAAVCLRNAAALDRDEFRWPYLLARALMRDGKTQDSAAAMAEAVKRMRNDVTATTPDYLAAMNFLGEAAVRLNKPEEARNMFEAAVQANPKASFPLFRLGQLASRAGDSERAISFFEKSLALTPGAVEIRRQLAAEHRRQGNTANAARFDVPGDANRKDKALGFSDPLYSSVLDLNQSAASLNRQGSRRAQLGRWREALALYERGMKANPDSVPACQNYGQALIEMDRAEEAQKTLEACAAGHPEDPGFRGLLCKAYAAAPATRQKALEIALAMRKEKPDDQEPLQLLAGVYAGMGRHADALRLYEEGGKMANSEAWPLMGQARELSALGRFSDARRKVERALESFPDNPDIKLTLARFLATSPDAKSRDGARAVKMTQEIIAGQYTALRGETMAVALAEAGRFDDALQAQRKAVATFSNLGAPQLGERLTSVLRSLEARKPWREQWPFKGAGMEKAPVVEEIGQ